MDVIIIVFVLLILFSLRKSNGDFLSREDCLAIRGIMSFVIIFGHLTQKTWGGGSYLVSH